MDRVTINFGRKSKVPKFDKNGFMLIKIKELPSITSSGILVNPKFSLEEWTELKRWVDSNYDREKFFEEFPKEKEYTPLYAREKRKQEFGGWKTIEEVMEI